MERIFDASWTYESGALDYASLPEENIPVYILGQCFDTVHDKSLLISCWRGFLWLTYRKNLAPICDVPNLTGDQGWGCMHRSGQMLLANLFLRIKRNEALPFCSWQHSEDVLCCEVLRFFVDSPGNLFSIHSVTSEAFKILEKKPGEWLGPNAVCQVLKQLFESNDRPLIPDLCMCVCRDGILIIDEILAILADTSKCNQKLFLMVPLRLGLVDTNPQYIPSLLRLFRLKQFSGLLGGKPNHACWFFGLLGDTEVLSLDPHVTQPFIDPLASNDFSSYHCSYVTRIPIKNLDPSLALTFYCSDSDSFLQLCSELKSIFSSDTSAALFDVVQEIPPAVSSSMADWPITSSEESSIDGGCRVGDDFEVI